MSAHSEFMPACPVCGSPTEAVTQAPTTVGGTELVIIRCTACTWWITGGEAPERRGVKRVTFVNDLVRRIDGLSLYVPQAHASQGRVR